MSIELSAVPSSTGVWTTTEQLNREIRHRTHSVASFPTQAAIVRLVAAVLAEQTDERAGGRRYLGLGVLTRCRATILPGAEPDIGADQLPDLTT